MRMEICLECGGGSRGSWEGGMGLRGQHEEHAERDNFAVWIGDGLQLALAIGV